MKKRSLVVIIGLLTLVFFIGVGKCEDKNAKNTPVAAKKETPVKPEKTKEEMLTDIKNNLKAYDEIFNSMPALKAQKDEAGNFFYTYKGIKLEDMSAEDLKKISLRIGQLAVKIRTENIQRQLNTIKNAQKLQGAGSQGAPGAVRTPAQPPHVPPSVPAVPKAPPAPPASPRR